MAYNKKLIEKLTKGKVVLKYDKESLTDLNLIIKEAFPTDVSDVMGANDYYYSNNGKSWKATDFPDYFNGKIVPIKDFIEEEKSIDKYKFTVDYVNRNNVIIECVDSDQAIKVNKLINGFDETCNFYKHKHLVYLCKIRNSAWSWQDEGINKQHINYFQRRYPIIQFEIINASEFIKNNTKMEDKEIIGYKLPSDLFNGQIKKDEVYYEKTFKNDIFYNPRYYNSNTINSSYKLPKEIVETWEPIYKSKERVFNMGSFEVVVKDGKAFHKNDDITNFVKELNKYFYPVNKFGGFTARIEEVLFNVTGCEHNQTKLSDWKKVYNALSLTE